MAEAYGLTPCTSGLASESKLSCSPKVQFGFVPNHSHHGGKTSRFALKNLFESKASNLTIVADVALWTENWFFSGAKRNGVFPLVMSSVAQQRGMMAGHVQELALKHNAMTADQKLAELRQQQRGFYGFC